MKKIATSLTLALLSVGAAAHADPMQVTPLTIMSGDERHAFTVEVADDREEISYGLMDRETLGLDQGMLFDFNPPYEPSMYMKNTLIPLDMLFIASDGRIEMIARNAVPGSLRTISPGLAVRGVLEINGGQAAELGVQPGDIIVHPIFENLDQLTSEPAVSDEPESDVEPAAPAE